MKWILPILLATHALACHTMEGDRIVGRDLAAAIPAFAALDADLAIATAPVPGSIRVMHAAELNRIAAAHGIELAAPVGDVCFERFKEALTEEKLLPALRSALDLEDATIEILDFVRIGVPRGTLEFSRTGLSPIGLWRGQVRYAPGRSVPIWVKVRVTVARTWFEATQPIATGKTIDASQLAKRTGPRFPFAPMPLDSIDRIAGHAATRSIQPGEPIFDNQLTNPREVERGDTVSVEVTSGDATIAFDAKAESSGHTGDSIVVRNPENGRYFQAKIEGKDKVCVKK